jgi:ATP-binding cassette, subfamily B, bacterial PglK
MKNKQHIKEVLCILGDRKSKLPWLIMIFLFSSVLDLLGIGLIAPYISLIIDPENFTQSKYFETLAIIGLPYQADKLILTFSALLVAIFSLKVLIYLYINKAIFSFCFKLESGIRSQLMHTYQSMRYQEYIQRNSSEYNYNIMQLSTQFSLKYLQSILRLASEFIVFIVILFLLAWSNAYALSLLVVLLFVIMFVYDYIFKVKVQEYGATSNKLSTRMIQIVNEGIGGLKEIRILGREEYFLNILRNRAEMYEEINVKASMISVMPRYFLEFGLILFIVLLVYGSLVFEYSTSSLLPVLGMFGVAAMRLVPSTNQIMSSLIQIRNNFNTVSILYEDLKDHKLFNKKNYDLVVFKSLYLKQIVFTYFGADKPALNNITIKIKAGDSIGLIGKSGSGKTTTIDLLLGLLKPDSGKIFYNDSLIEDLSYWQSKVAYIPQNIALLDDTLEKNIAINSKDNIDKVKIEKAIIQARLVDLVQDLPMGISTIIGDQGIRLSGGQRQRIALARAFYYDREILIMDEATSALDNETESEIVNEIRQLKGIKTVIVIAHRLTTLKHCDCIYRLDNGKIVEYGSYNSIMNKHNA